MKRLILFLFAIFVYATAFAQTIRWYVDDNVYTTTTCSTGDSITPPTAPTKPGYTFKEWKGFVPIEYLGSTGTQYIDTLIKGTDVYRANIAIKIGTDYTGRDQKLFGYSDSNNAAMYFTTYNKYYRGTNIPVSTSITKIQLKKYNQNLQREAIVSYDDNQFVVNSWWYSAGQATVNTFLVFALISGSNGVQKASYLCYYLQLYDVNDVLIRDMIPVRDSNNVPCMFDKVTGQFFYNQGTGNFIAGSVIKI